MDIRSTVCLADNGLDKGVDMNNKFEELPNLSIEDLEAEINFYDFLIKNENQIGGIEMSHRVWYESLKIEIRRRGLIMETKIKLVKDIDSLKN